MDELTKILNRLQEVDDRLGELFEKDDSELSEEELKEIKALNDEAKKLIARRDELRELKSIRDRTQARREADQEPANGLSTPAAGSGAGGQAPYQARFGEMWKYDNLDPGDHAVLAGILESAKLSGRSRYGASEDCVKALAIKVWDTKDDWLTAARAEMKRAGVPLEQKNGRLQVKADELNYSTQSGFGDEWIGVAYSTQLWRRILQDTPVVGRIPTVEMPQGTESMTIPLEGAAPTFYTVAQATAQDSNPGPITRTVTTSKLATANKSLTVAKIGAATYFTGELEEDSLIPWVAELRRSLEQEGAETLESLVIDGDTATGATTNINDIGGTPGGTEYWLAFNGFRKLALVTNTANSRDGGVLAVEDFLETVKLMGIAGRNAIQKDRVSFIIDVPTNWKSLELSEIKTQDVFSNPTIEEGELMSIFGYQTIVSANMHRPNQDATYGLKTNTAGKIDLDTASNNTKGAILAVRWDQWRMGWKRRMTFETDRVPSADATEIVVLMRMGLTHRDNEASAISYNLTV